MDDDQQFCLRWNNHQSTLISVFDTLLENGTLVDCTLAAEGKFLKAHKVVLSACSPYFATLLQEQYDKHPIFILKDVKYQELRAMMDYMYRGEVNISQDQLAALLKAAESLQIKGLSDNRSGAPRTEHHRGLNVPAVATSGGASGGSGKISGGYTLEQTKRARIGPSSMDSQDLSGSREGSSSPSRRRRKIRRRSIENVMTAHENSNSSQIQSNQSTLLQQSNANLAGVGAISAAASALATQIQVSAATLPTGTTGVTPLGANQGATQQLTTSVTKKTESVKGTSDAMNTDNVQAGAAAGADDQEMEHGKGDKLNHKHKSSGAGGGKDSELVIQPKSEYDEEGNEETVEDLTLDEEDMGMDDLDHNAGTSQGGEGSSQGYAAWQHDRSQDELLLATQDAQQRDPQDVKLEYQNSLMMNSFDGSGSNARFPCAVCGKSYLRKRHLQRHMRDECIGIPPRFSCDLCPSRFRRKYHMVRHLTSKHGIPPAIAQQTTGNGQRHRENTGNGVGNGMVAATGGGTNSGASGAGCDGTSSVGSVCGSQNGCDSPIPENLSLRKDHYEHENIPSPVDMRNGAVGGGGGYSPIPMPLPTYGLTGAITAISAAAAVIDGSGATNGTDGADAADRADEALPADMRLDTAGAAGGGGDGALGAAAVAPVVDGVTIKTEPLTPTKALNMMDDEWKMKLSLQLISNSLLKERLLNSMPFAYNNN